jgi:CheY-like chemotaxis protein
MMQNLKVLAVDDEELNLDIMNEYFEEANFESVCARDGVEALKALEKNDNINVIVLDRMMPNMDGMEFIRRMREVKTYRDIPIIMQTAASASHQVAEGIKAGVYYYLSKPYTKEVFLAIIRAANDDANRKNQLRAEIKEYGRGMTMLNSGEFSFRTLEEAKALAILVGSSLPDPETMIVGLTELLVNAVEHGNLGITYKEKGQLKMSKRWEEEVNRRLALPENQNKFATLSINKTSPEITIKVCDQGQGFDYNSFINFDPHRLSDPNGRGIMMTMNSGFTSVEYTDGGSKVECKIKMA